ncbi:MAG: ankyrin repeat domain-containing protein [Bacteroidales bacterium]|nr:ankyrin repeat domain-containing protein [Bacteroidales bacterium]
MIRRVIIFIFFVTPLLVSAQTSMDDSLLLLSIRNGNTEYVRQFITPDNINSTFGKDQVTPLNYAIINKQDEIARCLIHQGADLEIASNGKTPLLWACQLNKQKIAKCLLKHKASVNRVDDHKNSTLIYASINGNKKLVKFLIRKGARLEHKNHRGYTAYYYAVSANYQEIAHILRQAYKNNLPDYTEGPHITWNKSNTRATITYLVHKHSPYKSYKEKMTIKTSDHFIEFNGLSGDSSYYKIDVEYNPDTSIFENVEKIFIVGDIHGGYDPLIKLLFQNHIIDEKNQWIWGNGHLVFLGDVMDRGDKVTECLWLIYKLEQQAELAGGKVHLILGNHEIMNLQGDVRYIADKYMFLCDLLNVNYTRLFDKTTTLGQWLRNKNVVIRINDILFTHGGLYSPLMEKGLNMDQINKNIHCYLNNPKTECDTILSAYLLGLQGPLWYRGYVDNNPSYAYKMDAEQLRDLLSYFGASKIVVGHTYVDEITTLFNEQVIATDVSYMVPSGKLQGVFIDSTGYFRTDTEGNKVKLFWSDIPRWGN